MSDLGQPLCRKTEPTGYSNVSSEWLNTGGLMARMNFALQLTTNKMPGVSVDDASESMSAALRAPEFQKR